MASIKVCIVVIVFIYAVIVQVSVHEIDNNGWRIDTNLGHESEASLGGPTDLVS